MATSEIIALDHTNDESQAFLDHIDPETIVVEDSAFLGQVDRILRSEELRGSEVLRRLLKFLAQKSVSGEADELKEYVVAIEGLEKPTTYDPRHNSAVRIQVGRLRQKLANYYQKEGQHDPLLIDVPKGRFKLKCEHRECSIEAALHSSPVAATPVKPAEKPSVLRFKQAQGAMRAAAWVVAGIIVAMTGEAVLHRTQPSQVKASGISYPAGWDASVEELWKPFIATNRPMIVAIEDPLFVELDVKRGVYYRDRTLDSWNEVVSSPKVAAIRAVVKSDDIEPSRYYTAFGEVDASFLIAKLLGSRAQNLSVVRTTDLSMREVADNNVVFVGNENKFFNQQIQATPIETPLQPISGGIRNIHPGANEPELFVDHYSTAPSEEGFAYALVTHLPGPLGSNDVESFTSTRAAGYVAAVKAFTDPGFVRPLVAKLKETGGGHMPRYYQVLLKVQFRDEVPTEITYVLSRELHYTSKQ